MNQLLSCHHKSTMVFLWAPKLPAMGDSDFLQANTNHHMKQPAIYCPTRNIVCPSHKIHLLMKVICSVYSSSVHIMKLICSVQWRALHVTILLMVVFYYVFPIFTYCKALALIFPAIS